MKTVETPECDRMVAVAEESHGIGEFLDWLGMNGMAVAEWETMTECGWRSHETMRGGIPLKRCVDGQLVNADDEPLDRDCESCDGTGRVERVEPVLVPIGTGFEQLLARYFEIDLRKIEQERRAILESLR